MRINKIVSAQIVWKNAQAPKKNLTNMDYINICSNIL